MNDPQINDPPMNEPTIYLDNAASTPVDPAVAAAMAECLTADGTFANPSSQHGPGQRAKQLVEQARAQIAALINAPAERLVFTSGATEANNLALRGAFGRTIEPGRQLVTTRIEHPSVLDSARALAADGVDVTLLPCDRAGLVAPESVAAAISDKTALVSVMHVNNEIGVVQDIRAIAAVCRERNVPLHVDAAQSAGRVPLDVLGWGIDLCSLTAHKINGPKGVGALYVREGLHLSRLLHGGEQELGLRAGTLPTHQVVGMGKAFELAQSDADGEAARLTALRETLWAGLSAIDGVTRNGRKEDTAPHILSVSFSGISGESLLLALADIAISAGSACSSASPDPSHVLSGIGLSDARAQGSLRFGVGRFTTESEVQRVIERVTAEVGRLRGLANSAPDWCRA